MAYINKGSDKEKNIIAMDKKLQEAYDKIYTLSNKLDEKNVEVISLKKKIERLNSDIDKKIEDAIRKAITPIVKQYEEKLKEKDKRIFELECRLNINSNNSSLPPSKNPITSKICNSREKTGKKIGGQIGHPKHQLSAFKEDEITEIIEHKIDKCHKCNGTLKKTGEINRDELDFEIIIKKVRHKFYEYKCQHCNEIIKSEIPLELSSEIQYGSNVKALALCLYNEGFVAFNRVRKMISGLTNGEIEPSEGYLSKLQKKTGESLEGFVFDLKESLKKQLKIHWDDTVIKIGEKDKACLRIYATDKISLYKSHLNKNTAGMDEDGILQYLTEETTVIHDHLLHNYCEDYKYINAECNAHIVRKLQGIYENTKHEWSKKMRDLLVETLALKKNYISENKQEFEEKIENEISEKYDEALKAGRKESKEFKYQFDYINEFNLIEMLEKYKDNVLLWTKKFDIPFSNNLSETGLRMSKTKMKVSGLFQNIGSAESYANINSYMATCYKNGINKYKAIYELLNNNEYIVADLISKENDSNQ